jgi:hypothetical protein
MVWFRGVEYRRESEFDTTHGYAMSGGRRWCLGFRWPATGNAKSFGYDTKPSQ